MNTLKLFGLIVLISLTVSVGMIGLFHFVGGVVMVWRETDRINTEISKACVGSFEVPGMKTDQQWAEDGSILVMCDNGKERWIKVVK